MSDRDYIDFEMIKEKVSMPDLLDHYGLADKMEKKDSDTLIGPCPITGSDGQVFKVDTQKDIWYSFALEEDGAGGNVLDFVARMEDAEVLEAAHLINDWLSLESQEDQVREVV